MTDLRNSPSDSHPERLLTFSSGGWVLVLTALLMLGLLAWFSAPAFKRSITRPPGDGRNPESYLFDLSNFTEAREALAAGLAYRDLSPAMIEPLHLSAAAVLEMVQSRDKYLVSSDLVVGVELNGESRAYPMMVLAVHEVINDTLGGVPIAVTYHPLCDSTAVFDRRLDSPYGEAPAGRTLVFGVSGLLLNSNLLMYDRRDDGEVGGESLFSQLLGRAVSGPAVEEEISLQPIAYQISTWADWRRRHATTTVVDRDPAYMKRYKKVTHEPYYRSEAIWFPVAHEPPDDSPHPKERLVEVTVNGDSRVYLHSDIDRNADDEGVWIDEIGGKPIAFRLDRKTNALWIEAEDETIDVSRRDVMWFCWHAFYPARRPVGIDQPLRPVDR